MKEYFEREMRLLNEAASEFAEQFPEQARMLNLMSVQDRDPYIERLLEGVAFLTAQIRRKIDDDIPEICQTLLLQMWPHMLRPFPSATIMQFKFRSGQLQETYLLKENTQIQSDIVGDETEKITCKFRTTTAIKINPIVITDTETKTVGANKTTITMKIQIDNGADINKLDLSEINFYLHADYSTAAWLHYVLVHKTDAIKIVSANNFVTTLNDNQNFMAGNLATEDCLTPKTVRSFSGFHLLHEYFLFCEKYLFVKLSGLETVKWPKECNEFSIEITTYEPVPANTRLTKKNFLLHCVPAINLFSATSEPIKLTHRKYEQAIVADHDYKNSIRIYYVNEVTTINSITGHKETIIPFYSSNKEQKNCYHLSQHDDKTYLALADSCQLENTTASCKITTYNADYPRKYLHENQINIPTTDTPHFIYFTNIIRPSMPYSPPTQNEYRWQLLAHMSLNCNSLTDLKSQNSYFYYMIGLDVKRIKTI